MRHPKILYRPMFSTKGSSSYGKGIASNLVTEEQRVKYNSGGRVRAQKGLWTMRQGHKIPTSYLNQWEGDYEGSLNYPHIGERLYNPDIYEGEGDLPSIYDLNKYEYYGPLGQDKPYAIGKTAPLGKTGRGEKTIVARGDPDSEKGDVWFADEDTEVQKYPDDLSLMTAREELLDRKNKLVADITDTTITDDTTMPGNLGEKGLNMDDAMPLPPKAEDTETLDVAGIIDKYYDKKGSLGEAQFGLAGQVLKAAFQPKSKAMGTVGDAIGQFGKDAMADKKAFNKLAATGEIQRELYRMSRAEEGKQDRETKAYDAKLKAWLKKNDVAEDDISDIENYTGLIYGWDKGKRGEMTGHQHQDLIARFDEDFASEAIVISPTTTGIGKDKKTSLTEFDQAQLDGAEEGDAIIIGADVFIKDSSAPGKMRKVNYTQIKLAKKKKPEKPFKRFE